MARQQTRVKTLLISLRLRPYFDYNGDTVGIGISGSVDGLEPVFQKIKDLLNGKSTSSPVIMGLKR